MWTRVIWRRISTFRAHTTTSIKRYQSTQATNEVPNVLLVDTSALIFRAHHGFAGNPLTRPDGIEVSALYGLCSSLLMLIETLQPTHIACALDVASSRTERKALLPDYKGNRIKDVNYEALTRQLKLVPNFISAMGLKHVKHEGHEADDVIASLVEHIRVKHPDAVIRIVSSDKDFTQLLSEHPSVSLLKFKPTKAARVVDADGKTSDFISFTAPMCKERYGIEVSQFVDYLALVGDVADNIPGVPKVGDKTAAKLLNDYGDLQGILNAARKGDIKRDIIRKSLLDNAEQVLVWRQVAKLNHDLEVPDLDTIRFDGLQALATHMRHVFFDEYNFASIQERLTTMLSQYEPQKAIETDPVQADPVQSEPVKETSVLTSDSDKPSQDEAVSSEQQSTQPKVDNVKRRNSMFVMDETSGEADEDTEAPHIIMRSGQFR
jgi:DNA polymerase-1